MLIFSLFYSLFIIGIGFFINKYPDSLAGYNTMTIEKKRNVDIKSIASVYKKGMTYIGLITIVLTFLFYFSGLYILTILSVIYPLLIGILILSIITRKYDKNKQSRFKKSFPVIFIGGIIVLVTSFLIMSARPTQVDITDNEIKFTGLYGMTVDKEKISEVKLISSLPRIKLRTNGLGLGNIMKGEFLLDDLGSCRLFVNVPGSPYLFIQTDNGKKIIFNSKDAQYTKSIFEELKH